MEWWIWCVLGMVLLVAELITPGGFYLMFFGIAGLAVGVLTFFGISGPAWMQWILFSVISLASIGAFRGRMLRKFSSSTKGQDDLDLIVGERASAVETIAAGAMGRVNMRGTSWQARNFGESPIEAGQECKVERVDGLVLLIRGV
jgi:inner membrane protein